MFYDVVNCPESEEYRGYLVINFLGTLASPLVFRSLVRAGTTKQNKIRLLYSAFLYMNEFQ